MATVVLIPWCHLNADWRAIYRGVTAPVAIDAGACALEAILAKVQPAYGINTAFRPAREYPDRGGGTPRHRYAISAVACGRGGPTNAAADRPPNDDAEDRQPRRGAMIRARSVRPWN
jgi:hypothetical protein